MVDSSALEMRQAARSREFESHRLRSMKSFSGVIQKGAEHGRLLGYPTINIPLTDEHISGVYAARVTIGDSAPYMAAAFGDSRRGLLEAYILDFSDDLYGSSVRIDLYTKLREAKKFETTDDLKSAIAADVEAVRQYFHI